MKISETYDLPPPALSGSGSKGTSQLLAPLVMKVLIVFGCMVKWKAVAIRKEDIRFMLLKNCIFHIADLWACRS